MNNTVKSFLFAFAFLSCLFSCANDEEQGEESTHSPISGTWYCTRMECFDQNSNLVNSMDFEPSYSQSIAFTEGGKGYLISDSKEFLCLNTGGLRHYFEWSLIIEDGVNYLKVSVDNNIYKVSILTSSNLELEWTDGEKRYRYLFSKFGDYEEIPDNPGTPEGNRELLIGHWSCYQQEWLDYRETEVETHNYDPLEEQYILHFTNAENGYIKSGIDQLFEIKTGGWQKSFSWRVTDIYIYFDYDIKNRYKIENITSDSLQVSWNDYYTKITCYFVKIR